MSEIKHYTKLPLYQMRINLFGTKCTPLQFITLLVLYHEKIISSYFLEKINVTHYYSARRTIASLRKKGYVQDVGVIKDQKRYRQYELTDDGKNFFVELYDKVIK